jgi:site-specific recombinase XerD
VLAIPAKRFDKATVSFLNDTEVNAILAATDRHRWEGRRDHTLIVLAVQTGLRISELLGLNCGDIALGTGAHLRCQGKGRKQRAVPLGSTVEPVLRSWLDERHGRSDEPVFCTRTGRRLSPDAVQRRVSTYAAKAASQCPSLKNKRLSPHTFRHSNAMALLHAGVDTAVIALWLGHEDIRSTTAYLHADLVIKERALAMLTPINTTPGRYRAQDQLLGFLEAL